MVATAYPGGTSPKVYFSGPGSATYGSVTNTVHPFLNALYRWEPGCVVYMVITLNTGATNSVSSITGTGGAWSFVAALVRGSMRTEIWINTTSTSATPTVTLSATSQIDVWAIIAVGADATTPTVSATLSGVAASTAFDTGSVALAEDNCAVIQTVKIRAVAGANMLINRNIVPASLVFNTLTARNVSNPIGLGGSLIDMGVYNQWANAGKINWSPSGAAPGSSAGNINWTGTLSLARDFITATIIIRGQRVTLDDYNYAFGDDGIVLNNLTGSPIYDVDSIKGLTDIKIDAQSHDYDGADGGFTFAKYLAQKTIVIEGEVFVSPFTEAVADGLRVNFAPVAEDEPFHYVHPGSGKRAIYCKPVGFQADVSRARARGAMPYQIQLQASDPRSYSANQAVQLPVDTTISITPTGNRDTPSVIWFFNDIADPTAGTDYTFSKTQAIPGDTTQDRVIKIASVGLPPYHSYRLDLDRRRLTQGLTGTDYSYKITQKQWWMLEPGKVNKIIFHRPSASPEAATIYWAPAWI